ncbi:hypothetical protein [Halobacillus karajensis]|uniref:hypothetical protein n=1 Tax=Halobacillus karajensis TaxID=195088 RepID=UPI000AA9696A|nr:hypothetical protein [Halobacillus karajensis]
MKPVNTRKTNVVHTVQLEQWEVKAIREALGKQDTSVYELYCAFVCLERRGDEFK